MISTYELGHQPFGLASPATWLREAGASVSCLDLAVEQLDESVVRDADMIAFYIPMHTATRLATNLVERVRKLNPDAHVSFYGLYAPVNEPFLRKLGAQTVLGGEFEEGLVSVARRLAESRAGGQPASVPMDGGHSPTGQPDQTGEVAAQPEPLISLSRQTFIVPDRRALPTLDKYAYLELPDGQQRVVGYTEATRGCKHLCRHCPIVPVYNGRFRVVQRDVVLADVAGQVAGGAQHITFGDPDFFNGPTHALAVVRELHERFPAVTYDVTIKVEHLVKHSEQLPVLRDTGCLFVTSAVESVNDQILTYFDKLHTREDFVSVVHRFRELGLGFNPTFVTFTPWTTPENYLDLLQLIGELGLVGNVAPIQYAIRLLIPQGSRLLELPEVRDLVGEYDEPSLAYPWTHPDPRVDQLYHDVMEGQDIQHLHAGLADHGLPLRARCQPLVGVLVQQLVLGHEQLVLPVGVVDGAGHLHHRQMAALAEQPGDLPEQLDHAFPAALAQDLAQQEHHRHHVDALDGLLGERGDVGGVPFDDGEPAVEETTQTVNQRRHTPTAHVAAVAGNIGTDEISFTTVRREAIRAMTQSQVSATTPAAARAEATDRAHRHILAGKIVTGRDRHSPRLQKWRPRFPHTSTRKPTSRGPLTPRFGLGHNNLP